MICLVDCNNFYVSCERVFQPHLENTPVIILSNNDGCAVARSNEAKVFGIKMGQPFFEIKELCKKYKVFVFSSNYTLYADMSSRVMSILKDFGIQQEVYSIDEAFLDLTGIPNLTAYGQKIKSTIKQWVGIPVCVGMGETKVLAKFANHLAKKHVFLNGVCNLNELGLARVDNAMRITSVDEVWGIGRKIATKLHFMGIKTVYDLKISDAKHLRRIFNINVEKIIYELNGIQCIPLEEYQEPNKQIISSRSFGVGITDINDLLSSISYHLEQASAKLRKQGLYARQLTIFINSNRFQNDYYYNSETILLPQALDSFRHMAKHVERTIKNLYRQGITYKKSGIILTELVTDEFETIDLFDSINIKHDSTLHTIEQIRRKYGKLAINLAMTKLSNQWRMRNNHISQQYTSDIDDLLVIN